MQLPNYVCLSEANKRDDNQDSYMIVEFTPYGGLSPLLLLAVADGMGGFEHGAEVSREVLRKICLYLFQQLTIEPALNSRSTNADFGPVHLAAALHEAVSLADGHVRRLVAANNWGRAGATVAIAAVYDGELVGFNLGDSPLFHYKRANHTLRQLTENHTVAQALARDGVIKPEAVRYHEASSQLEFYVGGGMFPQPPPVHYCELNHGDLVLLCTDGISRLLDYEKMNRLLNQMEGVIESSHGLANVAEAIREAARDAGEMDNQTLIVWRYATPKATSQGLLE